MTTVLSATPAQVQAQRDRILASKIFAFSKRQSAFLEYVINAALDGRADKIKEFTLGIEVFGKDETFDPGIDSIVRVEASRLRAKLREYYDTEGQGDPVRIDIPKGHYVPAFHLAEVVHDTERKSAGRWQLQAVFSIIVVVLAYFGYRASLPESDLTTVVPSPPYNLAVLPLQDVSPSPERYFSEAMTDALISSLAEMQELRVTSISSVRKFADNPPDTEEIGRTLGVAYVVDGSIFRDDAHVRITARLVATDADEYVWTQTFDRPTLDLQSVQNEVAAAIAKQISHELLPSSGVDAEALNPAAYEAYMKGRYFYNQFTAEGFRRGMIFYQQAIDIEPDYAEAYAGLASCHCLLAGHGLELVSPVVAIPQAHSLATKALSLNPGLAEATAFLGIIDFKFGWDLQSAVEKLDRALEVNPSLFQAYVWRSQVLEAMGRHEAAVSGARYAKQLNPLSLAASLNLGWQLYQAGQLIEASAELDKLIDFDPEFWGGHWAKGHLYNKHELYENAIKEFQAAIERGGGHSLPIAALGYTFAIAGMTDEALGTLDELENLSKDVYVSPFHVATVYAGLDDPDLMFEWLERAFLVRARSLAWLDVSQEMLPYHDDPRYRNLLARIGLSIPSDPEHQ